MYIKVKDNQAEKYPYSISQLRNENKNMSFPAKPSDEMLVQFGIFRVTEVIPPVFTNAQLLVEGTPELIDGVWTQTWSVINKPSEEVNLLNEKLRTEAYKNESDPLFFKAQRGEIDMQVWIDKVAEIKSRYPNV